MKSGWKQENREELCAEMRKDGNNKESISENGASERAESGEAAGTA